MATEPRAGFRPPWALNVDSDESTDAASATGDATSLEEGSSDGQVVQASDGSETPAPIDGVEPAGDRPEAAPVAAEAPTVPAAGTTAPTKFQVDLARAMRAAAESARQESMERLAAESQAKIEAIRANSTDAATELRQRADDDIAEIRDWSKAELARIRAETDAKISDRKSWLEHEIEAHQESVEVLVSAVTSRVTAFEAELEAFFGRLAAEEDPTRIAVLAQSLPEVPSLDDDDVLDAAGSDATAVADDVATTGAADVEAAETGTSDVAGTSAPNGDEADPVATAFDAESHGEASPATIDPWADAPGWGTPLAQSNDDPAADGTESFAAVERRLAAFGLEGTPSDSATENDVSSVTASADGDAASAEGDAEPVATATADTTADVIAETDAEPVTAATEADAAGEASQSADDGAAGPIETVVIVDGLISVASIAGFKRSLGRVEGVHAVTVSSGPDGEFIFAVRHEESTALEDALPTMPGFGARVTGREAGKINVTAHDAENTSDDVILDAAGRRS